MSDPKLPFGSRLCKCNVCGLYFSSPTSFEDHRVGEVGTTSRRCMTPLELAELSWGERNGYWSSRPGGKLAGVEVRAARRATK